MNNVYKTKDLAEASFLLAENIELLKIVKEQGICWFQFRDKSKCEILVKSFWFQNPPLPAKSYYEAFQTLKKRIYS